VDRLDNSEKRIALTAAFFFFDVPLGGKDNVG
jgi:hypothetical protein